MVKEWLTLRLKWGGFFLLLQCLCFFSSWSSISQFFFFFFFFYSLLSLPSVTDWHPSSPIFTLIQINFIYCKVDHQTSSPLCDISVENEDKVPSPQTWSLSLWYLSTSFTFTLSCPHPHGSRGHWTWLTASPDPAALMLSALHTCFSLLGVSPQVYLENFTSFSYPNLHLHFITAKTYIYFMKLYFPLNIFTEKDTLCT